MRKPVRKEKKIILLTIDLIVFIGSMIVLLALSYSDKLSHTDLISKYGFSISIFSAASFIVLMWYVVKIMLRGKKIF